MSVEYENFLRRCKVQINCTFCNVKLLPNIYLRHLKDKHSEKLTAPNLCIWCMEYTWKRKDKSVNNYEHRMKCLRSRIAEKPEGTLVTPEQLAEMDLNRYLNCSECDEWYRTTRLQGEFVKPHEKFPDSFAAHIPIADKWYDLSVNYEFASMPKRIKLQEDLKLEIASLDNLRMDPESGIDGFWIRLFLVKGQKYCWFHYSIRVEAWPKFFECAHNNNNLFCVMPYWCLCNGGKEGKFDFHHRHIIVAVERENVGEFKKLMRTVTFADGTLSHMLDNRKMDSKYHKEILGVKHFMNAWRYVSSPQSMCSEKKVTADGVNQAFNESTFHGVKAGRPGGRKGGKCHYFISRPMIPHCLLGMALYFPTGFQEVTDILKMSTNMSRAKNAKRSKQGVWTVPMEEVYPDIRRHVTPTARDITLCSDGDGGYFFKGKEEKQKFKLRPENNKLERYDYNRVQLESGNAFVDMMNNAAYRVNKTQQYVLESVHEIRDELQDQIREKDKLIHKLYEQIQKLQQDSQRQEEKFRLEMQQQVKDFVDVLRKIN